MRGERSPVGAGDDLAQRALDRASPLLATGLVADARARGLAWEQVPPSHILDASLTLLYQLLIMLHIEGMGLVATDNLSALAREVAAVAGGHERDRDDRLSAAYGSDARTLHGRLEHALASARAAGYDVETWLPSARAWGGPDLAIPDEHLAPALDHLARRPDAAGLVPVDFGAIGVRHLGSIYERLTECRLAIDTSPLAVRLVGGRSVRRRSGSYYTPADVISYTIDHALRPVIGRRLTEAASLDEALTFRVVDPAMGSGHFLVAAIDAIGDHVMRWAQEAGLDAHRARRVVLERCTYGVDIDPWAVALAKASLRLHCAAPGLPPPSLDDRLKVGNALVDDDAGPASDRAFHWPTEFPEVFDGDHPGFDVVLGNPPWVAHSGRAAQPIEPRLKRYYRETYASFRRYRTTHGMFIERASQLLREDGRLGLVVPASIAELDGYAPVRQALDTRCEAVEPLRDFGDGVFARVTMPCMGLIAERKSAGRQRGAHGSIWRVGEPLLAGTAMSLHERLSALPPVPPDAFGERGFQTSPALRDHLREQPQPDDVFDTPLHEGGDAAEFHLRPPRIHCSSAALGAHLKPRQVYGQVDVVVRQTARWPIAARSDGLPFRNSLLAAYATPLLPWPALLSVLNSSLVRWLHYHRFRDARQESLPQVKIGHLRTIPAPLAATHDLLRLGRGLAERNAGIDDLERAELDAMVAAAYRLSPSEEAIIEEWARQTIRSR